MTQIRLSQWEEPSIFSSLCRNNQRCKIFKPSTDLLMKKPNPYYSMQTITQDFSYSQNGTTSLDHPLRISFRANSSNNLMILQSGMLQEMMMLTTSITQALLQTI